MCIFKGQIPDFQYNVLNVASFFKLNCSVSMTLYVYIKVNFTNPNRINMNKLKMSVTKKFKNLGVLALLSIGALTIQSCSKENAPAQEYTFLNITNTSPTLATFNIFVDQSKINQGAVAFLGNSGYMPLSPGDHNIKFTTASNEPVISKNISLETNGVTSLFLIDKAPNIDYLIVKDQLGNMNSSKAFVRFINLSPNAPSLDLADKDGDVIISAKAYKAASAFIEIDPKSYVLQLQDNGTEPELEPKDLESFEFKAGKSYTVIAAGLLGDTDRPLGGKILTN